MQTYYINEFEDEYILNIPKDVSYIEIERYWGAPKYYYEAITDSFLYNIIENQDYNSAVFSKENFTNDMFPLKVTTFSNEDLKTGTGLFNKSFSIPFDSSRLAIGKKNEISKNINFDEFQKFVNDEGSIYINKDFQDIDYDTARENLDVYSKNYIDKLPQNYEYSNITYKISKNDALRFGDTYTHYPWIERPKTRDYSRINAHNTLNAYYENGVATIDFRVNKIKYIETKDYSFYFADLQSIFGGKSFTSQVPVFAYPSVISTGTNNIPKYMYIMNYYTSYGTGHRYETTILHPNKLPVMVITPDYQIRFGKDILQANSVYFVPTYRGKDEYTTKPENTVGLEFLEETGVDNYYIDLKYSIQFYPNDPQLN